MQYYDYFPFKHHKKTYHLMGGIYLFITTLIFTLNNENNFIKNLFYVKNYLFLHILQYSFTTIKLFYAF